MITPAPFPALLGPDDPPPFQVLNPEGTAPLVLVCDHASNRLPEGLGDLGLPNGALDRHIAVDIGAAETTRHLAGLLNAPAVLCGYSRLVFDCNRLPGDPEASPSISDGTPIPGNRDLDEVEQEARAAAIFWPYQRAIGDVLAHQWRRLPDRPPALVAMHSFTPCMRGGAPRPWQVGLLWNRDDRLMRPLQAALAAQGVVVGDNEPYSGRLFNHTCDRHAQAAGLPHVSVELRQDLVTDATGCAAWAHRLAAALDGILGAADLHRVTFF